MKKVMAWFVFTVIMIVMVLSGCSGNDEVTESEAVGIVYGAHKYNPTLDIYDDDIIDEVKKASVTNGYVAVTIVDGAPYTYKTYNLRIEDKGQSAEKVLQIANANAQYVIEDISNAKGETPEVDTLTAISQASANISSTDRDVRKLIVFDNGLQTTGYLNMADTNIIDSDPDYIVNELKSRSAIPDLSNIDEVIWYGLGQARGEQPALSSQNKNNLESIWNAILTEGKAKNIQFENMELPKDYNDNDLPDVSIVPVIVEPITTPDTTVSNEVNDIIKLDETVLSFKADSDQFVNESVSSETLDNLANSLSSKSGIIYIVGSTATYGNKESSIELSGKRAEMVKRGLVERGVKCTLIAKGIGFSSCSIRVTDLDSNGNLNESQAAKNRCVFVMSENNSVVEELKQKNLI